ncbi:MAG: hypothetical protein WC666_03200 [Candidatus Paceibacterota bacterium]|jgi:hypothetical protein
MYYPNAVPTLPPQSQIVIPSKPKSKWINNVIKFLLFLMFFSWSAYILQLLSFIFFGTGGYVISGLIAFLAVPLWQPVIGVLLVVICLSALEKTLAPKWVITSGLFSLLMVFLVLEQMNTADYIIQAIGFILTAYTYYRFIQAYKREFEEISNFNKIISFISILIFLVCMAFLVAFSFSSEIKQGMEQAKEAGLKAQSSMNSKI